MNSYLSDPCLVYKKWPLTEEVGLWMMDGDDDDCKHDIGPWLKSSPGYIFLSYFS